MEIERHGGDSDAFAANFLCEMVRQSPPEGRQAIRRLAAEVDAWRRARRTYRTLWTPQRS